MKLAIGFALFCSIVFTSCKKDELPYSNTPSSIEGAWSYIGYSGGLAGLPFMSASSSDLYIQLKGSQLILKSGQASKCMEYQFKADSVTGNSYYQLTGLLTTSDTSIMLPMADMKIYNVYISNDTLTLYPSQCADCFTAIYTPSLKHFDCSDNNN